MTDEEEQRTANKRLAKKRFNAAFSNRKCSAEIDDTGGNGAT